jgi:hypothetical protein
MSPRYRLATGLDVDTKNASSMSFPGPRENLHRSRRARYWIEHLPAGEPGRARWIDSAAAIEWLACHGIPPTDERFPRDLLPLVEGDG